MLLLWASGYKKRTKTLFIFLGRCGEWENKRVSREKRDWTYLRDYTIFFLERNLYKEGKQSWDFLLWRDSCNLYSIYVAETE